GGTLALDAWMLQAGGWRSLGPRPITAGPGTGTRDANGGRDGVGLVVMRDGDGERTLMLGVPAALESESARLTILEVTAGGGRLRLATLGTDLDPAHEAWPIDIDGDGRDELLLSHSPSFGPDPAPEGGTTLTVLRPTEDGIATIATVAPEVS